MNPNDTPDPDLKSRFEAMRRHDGNLAPEFREVFPGARLEANGESATRRISFPFVPIAAAALLGLLLIPKFRSETPSPPSLVETLPVFLPSSPEPSPLFAGPLISRGDPAMPTDSLIPFHVHLQL